MGCQTNPQGRGAAKEEARMSPIAGYDNALQVRSTLAALLRERKQREDAGQGPEVLAIIDRNIELFTAEHERYKAEEAEEFKRQAEALQAAADAAAGV